MTDTRWLDDLHRLAEEGTPCVIVTVAGVRGHAPRDAGTKMIVTAHDAYGTIGGGNLEQTAVERARELLREGADAPETLTRRLTEREPARHGQQCCGGEVSLLLEPLSFARPTVAVFGAGHVGAALTRILSTLRLNVILIDSREVQLKPLQGETFAGEAGVSLRHAPIPETALADLPPGAHVVIMTHDHAEDIAIADAALRRPDLGFIGLIGSRVKWARFQARLQQEGHPPERIARITCPLGVPGIHGKAPEVIAISTAAQLLQVIEAQASSGTSALSPSEVTRA